MDTETLITPDNRVWVPFVEVKPDPIPAPTFGWFPEPDDIIVFVSHDNVTQPYRATEGDSNHLYTNETRNKIFYYNEATGEVEFNHFLTCKLTDKCNWQMKIAEMNTFRILTKFVSKRFGWCDKDAEETTPCVDQVTYNVIDCGGNRRKGIKTVKDDKGRQYIIVEMVEVTGDPPDYTYSHDPHLVQKQNCVTRTLTWKTSPQGDIRWLNMAPYKYVAYQVYDPDDDIVMVHTYPQVPFTATLHGFPVEVQQYCLQGSTTLVRVTGELEGWYVADESPIMDGLVSPYAGVSSRDYRCYIQADGWPSLENGQPEPTVPSCGWAIS